MIIEPRVSDVGIVLLGSFNPAIIGPDWLVNNEVLGKEAASSRDIAIISPQITNFRVSVFNFQVTPDRFQVTFDLAPFVELGDVVCKIFGELLPHTPIVQLGFNRSVHFSVGSEEKRNAIGRVLAPMEPWGAWSAEWKDREPPNRGGLSTLSVIEYVPDEQHKRRITATVQPSLLIENGAGIFASVNDHRELAGSTGVAAASLVAETFEPSVHRSDWIIDQVMKLRDSVNV